jgi:hypothetical protein
MVDVIADYRWCSHRAYLNGSQPNWLTLNWVLSAFGESLADARRQYARFMQDDSQTSTWEKFREGSEDDHRIAGDDRFIASLARDVSQPAMQQTLEELTQSICQKHGASEAELKSSSRERRSSMIRAEIGLAAIENKIASNAEIARFFNRNQSGLSRAINRLRRQRK